MKTFKLWKENYYREDQILYTKDTIDIQENTITCLIGCNGIGKSTVLTQMKRDTKTSLSKFAYDLAEDHKMSFRGIFGNEKPKEEYNDFYFCFEKDTTLWKTDEDMFRGTFGHNSCSTGEGLIFNFVPVLKAICKEFPKLKGKTLYLLLDDLDVGVSIDVLKEINFILADLQKRLTDAGITFYIVMTANSYEIIKGRDCVSCVDFSHHTFTDYETYADFVQSTRKYKEEREAQEETLATKHEDNEDEEDTEDE